MVPRTKYQGSDDAISISRDGTGFALCNLKDKSEKKTFLGKNIAKFLNCLQLKCLCSICQEHSDFGQFPYGSFKPDSQEAFAWFSIKVSVLKDLQYFKKEDKL